MAMREGFWRLGGFSRKHWERGGAKAFVVVTAFLVTAYANVLFFGKSLALSNNLNPLDPRFTVSNYGPRMVPADVWHRRNLMSYPNFRDPSAILFQWEPGGEFLRNALRDREMPLWNPYVGAGAPAMANLTPAYYFPPYLLLVSLGNTALLKNVYFLALQAGSALFVYLLLRRHGYGWQGSAFSAVAWISCGAMAQNAGSFIGQTASCIPAALYLTTRFAERPTWRWTASLALGYGTIALASFPPVLLVAFGLSALYAVVAISTAHPPWGERPSRLKIALRYAVSVALSLGLVTWYYAPAALAAQAATHARAFYRDAGLISFPLQSLYQLLSPVLMGGEEIYLRRLMPGTEFFYFPYAGIVAICAAGFAARNSSGDILLLSVSVGSAIMALKVLGVAPVQWLGYLPLLNAVHFAHYLGIGVCFVLSVLAGIGVDALQRGRSSVPRWLLLTLGFLLVVCTLFQLGWNAGVVAPPRSNRWLFEWTVLAILGSSFLALSSLAVRRGGSWRGRRVLLLGAFFLLGFEGLRNTIYPRQARWDVWRHPPVYIRELANRGPLLRVFTSGSPNPNTNGPFGIATVDSLLTFNSPRVFELYRRYWQPDSYLFLRQARHLPPEGVLDAAAVGALSIREIHDELLLEARRRGHTLIYGDGYVQIFERESPERCYFTSDFRVVEKSEALELLPQRSTREILLESLPSRGAPVPNRQDDPRVSITDFHRNRYVATLRAPRPGFLYCADSYFPGWTARVDGRLRPIAVANYAFRAVEVTTGDHRIEFEYRAPGLAFGTWISLVAGLAVAALLLLDRASIRASSPKQLSTLNGIHSIDGGEDD